MKIEKVAFTVYPTTDAERARAFYEETLGFVRGSHSKDGVWTEYDLPGGGCFALFMDKTGQNMKPGGGAAISFEVDDIDAVVAHLREKGATIRAEVFHSPVCRQAVCADPDGNTFLLHQLKKK